MLDHHRGGDHRERLVGREEAVATGQKIALEPALAQVLGEDLEDPAARVDMIVYLERFADEAAVLDLEDGTEPVRIDLVRTKQPEVRLTGVPREGVAQHLAEAA